MVTGQIRDIGQNVLQSLFQAGRSSSQVTATFSCLSHSFIRRIIIILCINYNIINCISAVINNNYGRLQDLILVFKIPVGT